MANPLLKSYTTGLSVLYVEDDPIGSVLIEKMLEPLFDPARAGRWGRVIAIAVTVAVLAPWLRDSYDDNKGVDDSSWRLMA